MKLDKDWEKKLVKKAIAGDVVAKQDLKNFCERLVARIATLYLNENPEKDLDILLSAGMNRFDEAFRGYQNRY